MHSLTGRTKFGLVVLLRFYHSRNLENPQMWKRSILLIFERRISISIKTNIELSSPATQFWRQKVLEVANDHRDITFAIASESDFEKELKDFGLDDSGEEINVGCFDDKNRKYRMEPDEEFDEDSLREFVENFKNGTIFCCAWYWYSYNTRPPKGWNKLGGVNAPLDRLYLPSGREGSTSLYVVEIVWLILGESQNVIRIFFDILIRIRNFFLL